MKTFTQVSRLSLLAALLACPMSASAQTLQACYEKAEGDVARKNEKAHIKIEDRSLRAAEKLVVKTEKKHLQTDQRSETKLIKYKRRCDIKFGGDDS